MQNISRLIYVKTKHEDTKAIFRRTRTFIIADTNILKTKVWHKESWLGAGFKNDIDYELSSIFNLTLRNRHCEFISY